MSAEVNAAAIALCPVARALNNEAEAAWDRWTSASVVVAETLAALSGELEVIPGAEHLVPMLAELENAIVEQDIASGEAARLLWAGLQEQARPGSARALSSGCNPTGPSR